MFHVKHSHRTSTHPRSSTQRSGALSAADRGKHARREGKQGVRDPLPRLPIAASPVYFRDVAESVVAGSHSGVRPLALSRGSTVMSMTLAAIGAVIAALLNLTIAPYLRIGGAQPDFLLTCAIVWTVVAGIEGGLVWAFIGGLMIDFLAPRPLGSTAFTLLLCVGGAALLARVFVQFRYIVPVVAVFIFSIVNA